MKKNVCLLLACLTAGTVFAEDAPAARTAAPAEKAPAAAAAPAAKELSPAALRRMERALDKAFKDNAEEEFLTQAEKMMSLPVEKGRDSALNLLVRFANDTKGHTKAIRQRAADMVFAHCEDDGYPVRCLWVHFIQRELSWEQMFTIAKRAGKDEPDTMMVLLWMLDDTPEKRADFESLYGKDYLPPVRNKYNSEVKACRELGANALKSVEAKDYDAALESLQKMKAYSPWSAYEALVNFGYGGLSKLPDDQARRFTAAVFEFALPGECCNVWMNNGILTRKATYEAKNKEEVSKIVKMYGMKMTGKSRMIQHLSFMKSRNFDKKFVDEVMAARFAQAKELRNATAAEPAPAAK